MKSILILTALASVTLVAGVADAKKMPAPKPAAQAAAKKVKPKPSYFLASDPHVPLAMVEANGAFKQVGARGKDCGPSKRWAKPKSHWKALDAWGQVSGEFDVAGSELYDVTHCRELSFVARNGTEGVGLFVSSDSGFSPPAKTVSYTPTDAEKERFEHFVKTIEDAYVNGKPSGKHEPAVNRTRFFAMPEMKSSQVKDGSEATPRHWAVAGGPVLIVAYVGEHGKWKVATVKSPMGLIDSYKPIAVFDMNGDSIPEIVYRSSDGPSWSDSVLSYSKDLDQWTDAATSPGGATL